MSKISLKDKLLSLALIEIAFSGISWQKDAEGKLIAVLQLATPKTLVRGSQEFEFEGKRYPLVAKDVKEVKVHEENFNDDFVFDSDTDTGHYKGSDLILDVSQGGQVWMVKTSYANMGREMRRTSRNTRLQAATGFIPTTTDKPPVNATPAGNKAVEPVDTAKTGKN